MSALEEYLGDGKAKLTVGGELAHSKEFGCKAQAFVSVSVTCNNDEETLEAVHNIIQPKVQELINQDLELMIEDRDRFLGQHQGGLTSKPEGKVARSGVTAKPKLRASPKAGTKSKAKGKVRIKPSYGR